MTPVGLAVILAVGSPTLSVPVGAVFALRIAVPGYAGNALTVRRASDDTTQAIGFVGDDLDVASLETFCAGTDGFVTTWYDQSGSAQNAVNATTGDQPQIASSGSVIRNEVGDVAVLFASKVLTATLDAAVSNQDATAFIVGHGTTDQFAQFFTLGSFATLELRHQDLGVLRVTIGDGATTEQLVNFDGRQAYSSYPAIFALTFDGFDVTWARNYQEIATKTHAKAESSSNQLLIGGKRFTPAETYISEFQLFDTALTSSQRLQTYLDINSVFDYGSSTTNTGLLPQYESWAVDLYDWLETLTTTDVDVTLSALSWDSTYADLDELSNMWLAFEKSGQKLYPEELLRSDKGWSVLDDGAGKGIEATGAVRMHRNGNNTGTQAPNCAHWYSQSVPLAAGEGNPHYQSPPVGMRALVAAAVSLMMHDDTQATSAFFSVSDFTGGALLGSVEAYRLCKSEVSATVQGYFAEAFRWTAWKVLQYGPHKVNANMDCKAVAALAHAWHEVDATGKDYCLRACKKILFGSETGTAATTDPIAGIYAAHGSILEGESSETTYNGHSIFHLVQAYAATRGEADWDFLAPVIDAMTTFKTIQSFPEPTGRIVGPSGYAGRTGGSIWNDQGGSMKTRDITIAADFTSGRPLARPVSLVDAATMVTNISGRVSAINSSQDFTVPDTSTPDIYQAVSAHWVSDTHWNPTPGWHVALKTLIDADDPTTRVPFARTATINTNLNDEFWAFKDTDGSREFGWFLESLPYTGDYSGWYGGALQTFWADDYGIALIAKHDKSGNEVGDNENTRVWAEVDTWATVHLWGMDDSGTPTAFSTAATDQMNFVSTISEGAGTPNATLAGVLGPVNGTSGTTQGMETNAEITGQLDWDITYSARANGLDVQLDITSDQADSVTELWSTIPVFLRDSAQAISDATIEYYDGAAYVAMSTSLVSTKNLRIGRDWGSGPVYLYITMGQAESMKLSAAVWQQTYQDDARVRNIHVDLHSTTPGSAALLPASRTLDWSITTASSIIGLTANSITSTAVVGAPGASEVMPPVASITEPQTGDPLPVGRRWAVLADVTFDGTGPGVDLEYSTNSQVSWVSVGAMTNTSGTLWQYFGGSIPSGVTDIRVVATDTGGTDNAVLVIPAKATSIVFHDLYDVADGDVLNTTYDGWEVNTTGYLYRMNSNAETLGGKAIATGGNTTSIGINTDSEDLIIEADVTQNSAGILSGALIGSGIFSRSLRNDSAQRFNNYSLTLITQTNELQLQVYTGTGDAGLDQAYDVPGYVSTTTYRLSMDFRGNVLVMQLRNSITDAVIVEDVHFDATYHQSSRDRHGLTMPTSAEFDNLKIWVFVDEPAGDNLTADSISATPVVGAPTLSEAGGADALAADGITTTPVVGTPSAGQEHSLSANGIAASHVVGSPGITQVHALTAGGITTTPVAVPPNMTGAETLDSVGITAGPVVGSPAIADVHALAADSITVNPVLDETPTLGQVVSISADGLTASPLFGTPAIGQPGSLVANEVTIAPIVGSPSVGQSHVMVAGGIAATPVLGVPVSDSISIDLTASGLLIPSIGYMMPAVDFSQTPCDLGEVNKETTAIGNHC